MTAKIEPFAGCRHYLFADCPWRPPIHPTDEAARKPRSHAGAFVCHSRQKSLRGARRSAPPGFEMIALNVLG